MKRTTLSVIGAALALALVGCAPAATEEPKAPADAKTAAPVETAEPTIEPVVEVDPPACWDLEVPAGITYMLTTDQDSSLSPCVMISQSKNAVAAGDAWIDELIAQGWMESEVTGATGKVRSALRNGDGKIAQYQEVFASEGSPADGVAFAIAQIPS
ncbi:hypothetical protein [Microbacterium caowuchunii]|uniref:DUF3558 domain-containing protein n=1 Tax=Microbacterium caowuchunii TaxID=2614638 RepID=A0A5N0TKS6_9MICO|nr:hypothetical protein [Microbacterium caowuchunii]KAA9135151.1 hypothetical protein F6B40_05625 [Microbacterium caowuchunii]